MAQQHHLPHILAFLFYKNESSLTAFLFCISDAVQQLASLSHTFSANSVVMASAEKLLFNIIEGLHIPDEQLLPLSFDETLEESVEKVCN